VYLYNTLDIVQHALRRPKMDIVFTIIVDTISCEVWRSWMVSSTPLRHNLWL